MLLERTPKLLKKRLTGTQAELPLGLTRTTHCLEHLHLLATLAVEITALPASNSIHKPMAFL